MLGAYFVGFAPNQYLDLFLLLPVSVLLHVLEKGEQNTALGKARVESQSLENWATELAKSFI